MTQLQVLTMRTTAALGRLAELQRRASDMPGSSGSVARSALKELTAALEELQVASEQLHAQVEELTSSRLRVDELANRLKEFISILPLSCVWTDPAGMILETNDAAAALLNVARARLPGKPLMLFLTDRTPFFEALGALRADSGGAVDLVVTVRPRERRPRPARLSARVLAHDPRWCWFLQPLDSDVSSIPGPDPDVE